MNSNVRIPSQRQRVSSALMTAAIHRTPVHESSQRCRIRSSWDPEKSEGGQHPHKAAMRSMELMIGAVKPRVEKALGPLGQVAAE